MKDWISLALEALKSLFGFGEKIADNKGQKIPLQENAIKERAETVVVRQDNKQHRLRKVIPKREIAAKIQLLDLKWRTQKRIKKKCFALIEAGNEITGIEWVGEKIVISLKDSEIEI